MYGPECAPPPLACLKVGSAPKDQQVFPAPAGPAAQQHGGQLEQAPVRPHTQQLSGGRLPCAVGQRQPAALPALAEDERPAVRADVLRPLPAAGGFFGGGGGDS